MPTKIAGQHPATHDRRQCERRKAPRRAEDRERERALRERHRKLQSLLELGQIIALDLELEGMLRQIAQKASEVMEADRCTIFLHDTQTDELWSTVAMGLTDRVIRIPSGVGLAGHAFRTGETIRLEDAYGDSRFNKEVDATTGYRTRSVLCIPIYNRSGDALGVIQLLNKTEGAFTEEDVTFLKTFANHASVFIETAQLQKARIEALERSHEELRRLNRAKDKAIHHLSHELGTPLAVIQGIIRLIRRKLITSSPPYHWVGFFEALDRHLNRLMEIQREADVIIRSHEGLVQGPIHEEMERLWRRVKEVSEVPEEIQGHGDALIAWMKRSLGEALTSSEPISLHSLVHRVTQEAVRRAGHRKVRLLIEGGSGLYVSIDPGIIQEALEGLLKNAFENTPDEGQIRIVMESEGHHALLKIQDSGIGITEENLGLIFNGLYPTQETELYASKRPYDFNAGGKGLDLLRMKVYSHHYGFDIRAESRRCTHLPTDRDICPGRISACARSRNIQDCLDSGGSTFCVSLPMAQDSHGRKQGD